MIYDNKKTILCLYWEENKCKYINTPDICKYAHGIQDMNKIMEFCKYGSKCNRPRCIYNHGDILPIKLNMVCDIPITIKYKKNKKHKEHKENNVKLEDGCINKYLNNTRKKETIIKQIDENKNINEKIIGKICFQNTELEHDDLYYINKIKILQEKNQQASYKIIELNNIIYNIKRENKFLNNKVIKNIDTKENKNEKLKSKYQKWINVYNIFQKYENNYSIIKKNINEIHNYFKDNNIYKIKQRCFKIYNYYNNLQIGDVTEYLSISKILDL